jgi:hypothetical protein
MKTILEVDDRGQLQIPPGLIGYPQPHSRFEAEVNEDHLVLRPHGRQATLHQWFAADPRQRSEDVQRWLEKERPPAPPLKDEVLRRESIYE